MNVNVTAQIVIRHLSGSKANQIELLPLGEANEITIGRDPAAKISFSAKGDDVVSRRHAVIRVSSGDQLAFQIADLNSSNGTFLNDEKITGESELLPEDVVELGKNGPKFTFDVQPRPARLESRTRVLDLDAANQTRLMKVAEDATSTVTSEIAAKGVTGASLLAGSGEPAKVGVGKNTVLHMLSQERKSVSRSWMSAVAGLAVFVALGGGAFYYKHLQDQADHQVALEKLKAQDLETRNSADTFARGIGIGAQDILTKYGAATVHIDVQWRLYDRQTGKPIFHKTLEYDNKRYPAYVRLPGNLGVVRWLTLDDDSRSNLAIGESASGSGFVVAENGFILTNKHVASSWALRYDVPDERLGFLYDYGGGPGANIRAEELKGLLKAGRGADGKRLTDEDREKLTTEINKLIALGKPEIINLNNSRYTSDLSSWVPETGGFIFSSERLIANVIGEWNVADPASNAKRNFAGRNELLEVKFPGSRLPINANLIRASSESDAALIKIDTPQTLTKLELATDEPKTAERVIVLGYPGVAQRTYAQSQTIENGQPRKITDFIYEPFVTEGIISLIAPALKTENGVTTGGIGGDVIQLSINSTGAGNSGGPVFNKEGKVIGLFTYGISRGGANSSGAVPIKYGRDLLLSQRQ